MAGLGGARVKGLAASSGRTLVQLSENAVRTPPALLPSFVRPSSAPTWKLPTDSPQLVGS